MPVRHGSRGAWRRAAGGYAGLLLLAAAALLAWTGAAPPAQAQDGITVHGKQLLRSYDLPLETLAKYERFNAQPHVRGGLLPDTEDWTGEALPLAPSGNPYTLVVKVAGNAIAAGEVETRWQPGWSVEGMVRGTPLPALAAKAAQAGERVEQTASAGPVSVQEDRRMAPFLGFAGSSNLKIDRVQVEVWSGLGKSTGLQKFFAWSPLLIGLVMLGGVLWLRRG